VNDGENKGLTVSPIESAGYDNSFAININSICRAFNSLREGPKWPMCRYFGNPCECVILNALQSRLMESHQNSLLQSNRTRMADAPEIATSHGTVKYAQCKALILGPTSYLVVNPPAKSVRPVATPR
jgi:hypothetical protein